MNISEKSFEEHKTDVIGALQSYLTECQKEVTGILEAVGWTPEHFKRQEDIVSCSFDSSHRMPRKHLEKHEQKCELLYIGYKKEDLDDVLENSNLLSENTSRGSSVLIDKDTMNRVLRDHHVQNHSLFFAQNKVPLTPDEVTVKLTPQERAAIYSYVVKKGKDEKKIADFDTDQFLSTDLQEIIKQRELGDKNKPKSYLDYLAARRDYKRRRQSYRAKNVHITRKSYTEIIREVIENQTEYVASIRKEETEQEESKHKGQTTQSDEDSEVSSRGRSFSRKRGHKGKSRTRDRENDHDSDLDKKERKDESVHRERDKSKKKKKHKKHKHHKHKQRSYSSSESRSRSRSRSER